MLNKVLSKFYFKFRIFFYEHGIELLMQLIIIQIFRLRNKLKHPKFHETIDYVDCDHEIIEYCETVAYINYWETKGYYFHNGKLIKTTHKNYPDSYLTCTLANSFN